MATPTFYPLIHNEWVKTYKSIKIYNPFNSNKIAKVYLVEGDFMDMAVESALKGFQFSRRLSGFERYEFLSKIAQGIQSSQAKLVETIVSESGKPIRFARQEVERAQLTFQWAAEEARRMGGELIPLDMASHSKGYFGIFRRFPRGVVLGISPFNFPLNLVAHKIAPAIASGNSIILKPASTTPLTALRLGDIIKSTGIPAGIVNILPTSGKNAESLVKDGRIKKLSFTGSAQIGWYLRSLAGKKHVTLELGGNAATIVEPEAELDEIVPKLVTGAFAYSGQICISIQRIYVQEMIFDTFLEKFVKETREHAIVGNPSSPQTMIGPMIDNESAKRAESWVQEALKHGARMILSGKLTKNMMEPVILTNTSRDMKVVCEEIFAPVVCIEPYRDFTDAINLVNNSHYGLQTGVFSNDFKKIQMAYQLLEVGGIIVNDVPTFRIDPMPYGGIKDSGLGREGVRFAMEEMTEIKLLAVKGITA